jgi:hypothetical protein
MKPVLIHDCFRRFNDLRRLSVGRTWRFLLLSCVENAFGDHVALGDTVGLDPSQGSQSAKRLAVYTIFFLRSTKPTISSYVGKFHSVNVHKDVHGCVIAFFGCGDAMMTSVFRLGREISTLTTRD